MWRRRPSAFAYRLMTPLKTNMPKAGDFSLEAIQGLGNPVPLLVKNAGEQLLELWLEPIGEDYWLEPGESVTVTSYGLWLDRPFEIVHEAERILVWVTSWFATVTDAEGAEVSPGRPAREQ